MAEREFVAAEASLGLGDLAVILFFQAGFVIGGARVSVGVGVVFNV